MDAFDSSAILWDFANFESDDDFLTRLQKQFPPVPLYPAAIPALTPPSDDSSPSPPTIPDTHSSPNQPPVRLSSLQPTDSGEDPALKRKASDDSLSDEGPIQKNPHLGTYCPP